MSLHATRPEAIAAVHRQRKRQLISSAIIGFLAVTLLMLVLSLILLSPITKEIPVIVSYEYEKEPVENPETQPKETPKKKPSAPSANLSRVIASSAVANVSIPIPDINVEAPSLEFGVGDDFGSGWGGTGGNGGGSASFFNTSTQAERVAYVIDYSASMSGKREQLMRAELARSVGELSGSIQYQLIFFAGPAWVAGDEVRVARGDGSNSKVISKAVGGKEEIYEWTTTGGANGFKPKEGSKRQTPTWLRATSSQIQESMNIIQNNKLVWGTTWEPAIDMALNMNPKPDVVFFMTDGSCGGNIIQIAEDLGRRAKKEGVIINTVAMMQPKTEKAMRVMAESSGGTFTLIGPDGKPQRPDEGR